MQPVNIAGIPAELTALAQFVTWKYNPEQRKLPCAVDTGKVADAHAPSSHGTFEAAIAAYRKRHHAGIGFDFTPNDPYTGIDLDDCIAEDGTVKPIAAEIIKAMNTYTEISPSGKGVKMWVRGRVPTSVTPTPIGDGIKVEIYSEGRFFTMTGHRLEGTPTEIRDVDQELTALYLQARPPRPVQPQPPRAQVPIASDTDHARRYALAALESEHQAMQAAGEGERHNTRLRAAYALAGYIPHITDDEITAALTVNFGPDEAGARKTIADGIAAGREHPRTIPAPEPRHTHISSTTYTVDESTPEGAAREIAGLRARVDHLEGWRAWAMIILALPNTQLSPGAKVVALSLYSELQSREERGITQPAPLWIEGQAPRAGYSPKQYGQKLIELADVGALRREQARDSRTGNSKTLIAPAAWHEPATWTPSEPRQQGGTRPGAGRPAPACATCPPETPIIEHEQKTRTMICGRCGAILSQETTATAREWHPNNQVECCPPQSPEQAAPDNGPTPNNQVKCWSRSTLDIEDAAANPQLEAPEKDCGILQDPQLDCWPSQGLVSPNNQDECWPAVPAIIEDTDDQTAAIQCADQLQFDLRSPESNAYKTAYEAQ